MVSIQYPSLNYLADSRSGDRSFETAFGLARDFKDRRKWDKLVEVYADSVGQQPMSIAALAGPQPQATDPASQRVASAHAVSGDPATWRNAIASIESAGSGDYNAVGPTDAKLGRALGKYQVMEANIGPWSKEVFGKEMTPEQFLASPKAQDVIFDRKFGSYVQKFGSPEKAAQAWFAGEGGVGQMDRQDSLGTSVADYTNKFSQATGGPQGAVNAMAGGSGPQMAQAPSGGSLLPPREVLVELLRNPETRLKGIELIQEGRKAQAGDPEAALKLRKLQLEIGQLENPQQKPTADLQEYEFAKSQGFNGSFVDFQLAQKKAGATSVNVNTGEPGDGELRKSLDKAEGDQWATFKQTAATSGSSQQDFAILDELIQIAPQGPITGRLAEAFPGVSTAGDAFQSIVKRIAPTLRAPGSGATSDIEYDGMLRSLPALRNNPDANRLINQIMKEKAALNVQRGDIITQYQTGALSAADARRQLAELDKVSIITPDMKRLLGIAGGGGGGNRTATGVQWSIDD